MFVHLDAGRVDRPKSAPRFLAQMSEDLVPNPALTPLFPTRIEGRVGRENTQSTPSATFSDAIKQGLQNQLRWDWRAASLIREYRIGTVLVQINFFSSLIRAMSAE